MKEYRYRYQLSQNVLINICEASGYIVDEIKSVKMMLTIFLFSRRWSSVTLNSTIMNL
jgi:hypothetical protein